MTSLADTELLRTRWRRALKHHAIDTINRDDFAVGGLVTRLQLPSVHLLILSADPEAEVLHLDDALWAWLEAQRAWTSTAGPSASAIGDARPHTRQRSWTGMEPGRTTSQFIDLVPSKSDWETVVDARGRPKRANPPARLTSRL